MKSIVLSFSLFVCAIVFVLASEADYRESVSSGDLYCEMVESGAWGDYKGNYNEVCK